MGRLTHTVSGSIATVRSPAVAPIESLKVHFSPIQEGTGDPSPSNVRPITGWTGVTGYKVGKNLMHCIGWSAWGLNSISANRAIANTYGTTLNTTDFIGQDGAVVVTQTDHPSSEDSSILIQSYKNGYVCIVPDNLKFGRTYNISFKVTDIISNPLNASLTDFRICSPSGIQYNAVLVNDNKICFNNVIYSQNTNQPGRTTIDIRICGMSCTISEFMVCDVTDFNYDYEPYSGETIPVTFPAVGKNLFDKNSTPFQTGKYISDVISGVPQYTTNSNYNVYKIPIKSSTTYTFGPIKGGNGAICGTMQKAQNIMSRYEFNNGGNEGTTHTFTSYSGDGYLLLSVAINGAYKCDDILQLEEGSSVTTYEAFDNTMYGGYVDLATGDVYKEYKRIIYDGSEDENWGKLTSGSATAFGMHMSASDKEKALYSDISSNYLKTISHNATWGNYDNWISDNVSEIATGIQSITTVSAWKEYLSEHNLVVCYKLKTPLKIATLTPQELATFKGYTNFWSNAGDVDVTYQVVESSEMTKERQKIFAGNAPTIHTASGSVANFEMEPGLNRNLKSCKVGFLPVQEGSGDPSPTNDRPITGWTGVTGYKCGKSLFRFLTNPMSTAIDYNGYSGWQSKQYIAKSLKGAKVTYSAYIDATSIASGDNCVAIWAQDSNGTYIIAGSRGNVIQPGTSGWSKITLIIPTDTDWIAFGLTLKANGVASNPMVELGTEQTTYEPYSAPTSYPVSWESQRTVYGGYVDLVTGKVWKNYDAIDLGSTSWKYHKYGNYNGGYNNSFQNILKKYNATEIPNAYCTNLFMCNDNTFNNLNLNHIITINIFGMIKVAYDEAISAEHLKSLLSGILLVAELETPQLVTTLTPTQIQALKGTNNIFSDANGIIEVKYWSH